MSLETKIEALTAAVNELVKVIAASHALNPAPTPIPVAPVPAPAPAPVMPPPPTFVAPPVQTPVAAMPFNDGKGLIDYVMSKYRALGPQKGAEIQKVLTNLGYGNINDVKAEHYGALFAGIEAL